MSESSWTIDTLKEHFDGILVERDKALGRALAANEKRLDGLNEIRGIMADSAAKFITRREAMWAIMALLALIGLVWKR